MEKEWLEDREGRNLDQLIELEEKYRIDSLVLAVEDALMDKDDPTVPERVVLVVESMEREVNNGGYEQFFSNIGEYTPWLLDSLERIGAHKTMEISARAIQALGAEPDWELDQFADAALDANDAMRKKLDDCDNAYYALEGESIEDELWKYIKDNRAEISLG